MAEKQRLDVALVERGLVESRNKAQRLVMAGRVRVDGQVAIKPSLGVAPQAEIRVEGGPKYVSRGGIKLEAALVAFGTDVQEMTCADVGASTGGFTDCLLQHGAARVYAIDVGHGLLHWKLRQDERVVAMERTNARYLQRLAEPVHLVTMDVSFISLRLLFPVIAGWLSGDGEVIPLIKPQFEAGRQQVGKGGVVRDVEVRRHVLEQVLASAAGAGLAPAGLIESPLQGPKGNVEYLAWLRQNGTEAEIDRLIGGVFAY